MNLGRLPIAASPTWRYIRAPCSWGMSNGSRPGQEAEYGRGFYGIVTGVRGRSRANASLFSKYFEIVRLDIWGRKIPERQKK